jgi:preprotein translocase subunit SecG
MFYTIILTIILIICVLLTIVVLVQPGQDQGLSAGLAGGSLSGGAGLGARRTADLLTKSTTVLATALLVLSVLSNFVIQRTGPQKSLIQQNETTEQPINNGLNNNPSNQNSTVPTLPTDSSSTGSQ